MMDIKAVGAGGGSIARLDPVAGIAVGPQSAGSTPGPACYGQGGTEPTVTDANLVLGYLDPGNYHGGELPLDRRRAERAIERRIAKPLGIDVVDAARRIRQIVDERMGSEIFREVTLKGYDPREFTVFSFGGGGPLHCCGYAGVLDAEQVVVPPHSSVFSASGAAGLELLRIYERSTWMVLFNPLTKQLFAEYERFNEIMAELRAQAARDFADEGFAPEQLRTALELDVRSTGQLYVITIASPVERIASDNDLAAVLQAYFAEYEDRFGDLALTREVGVSIDAIRLRAWVPREPWRLAPRERGERGVAAAQSGERDCWWKAGGFQATKVYDYARLAPGHEMAGPAVIEADDTTVLVEPGWLGRMDEYGFFTMSRERPR